MVASEQGLQWGTQRQDPETPGEVGPVKMSHREGSWSSGGGPGGGEGHSLERVHAKGHVHARAVGQEGSEGCLLKQPKDQDLVPGGTGRAGAREPDQHPYPQRQKHTQRKTERQTTDIHGDTKRQKAKTDPAR